MEEVIKLDIIIYNKRLQNRLGINKNNYEKYIWKYKTGEKNGKGKEYELVTNLS